MKKVMLVEDDETMLSLLGTLLEMEGFNVVKLDRFNNVVEEVRAVMPDVLLMDVHLQKVDGLALLEQMRKDQAFSKMRIMMSSGIDVSTSSMAKGANEFLLKPYMPDELIEKVKRLAAS